MTVRAAVRVAPGTSSEVTARSRSSGTPYHAGRLPHLVREVPCSVLVARTPPDPARTPRSLAVGDSSAAPAVCAVAASPAEPSGAELRRALARNEKRAERPPASSVLVVGET